VLAGASQVRGTPPPQAAPQGASANAPELGAALSDTGQDGPSTGPTGALGQEDGK
jgi:NADH-quinone oxidoreductase subunit J